MKSLDDYKEKCEFVNKAAIQIMEGMLSKGCSNYDWTSSIDYPDGPNKGAKVAYDIAEELYKEKERRGY